MSILRQLPDNPKFDKYRDEYKKSVDEASRYLTKSKIVFHESVYNYNKECIAQKAIINLLKQPIYDRDTHSIYLERCTTANKKMTLRCSSDILSAIYFPSFITNIKIHINTSILNIKLCENNDELSLEEILNEAQNLPDSMNMTELECILKMMREGNKHYIHQQLNTLNLNGVEYKRYNIIQPYIPRVSIALTSIILELDVDCDIYLENIMTNADESWRLNKLDHVLYTKNYNYNTNENEDVIIICANGGIYKCVYESDIESPDIESPDIESSYIESPDIESPDIESSYIEVGGDFNEYKYNKNDFQ